MLERTASIKVRNNFLSYGICQNTGVDCKDPESESGIVMGVSSTLRVGGPVGSKFDSAMDGTEARLVLRQADFSFKYEQTDKQS